MSEDRIYKAVSGTIMDARIKIAKMYKYGVTADEVDAELSRLQDEAGQAAIQAARESRWIRIEDR